MRGLIEKLSRHIGRIKHHLGSPFAIAHIDEQHAPKIAFGVHPTADGHLLPGMFRPQFVAMMRSFHFRSQIRRFWRNRAADVAR